MDSYLFNLINQFALKWVWLDCLGFFFAEILPYFLFLIILILAIKNYKIAIQAIGAGILARIIVEFIRLIWHRPRPFVYNNVNLLFEHNGYSFPSGHAVFFFAVSAVIYLYNKKLGIFFFISSILIVLARVFSGIHWPSDVLAGAILGIVVGYLVYKVFNKKLG